ncbi:hypothetical protein MTR67_020007 [Solanum verrucosum]|uniref:Uncharacterized protein n=1 Tax=Solanum verrucosum TaxID=315347 RepID=A0AAF0QMI5_SOLVR|nr:hypothetical protein MTR67_020007 [Solanum verrucosum]
MVNCNSEGIMFIEAEANVELEKLGDSIIPPCPYLEEILYNEPGSDGIIGCPLMLVQRTIALNIHSKETVHLSYVVNVRVVRSQNMRLPLGYYGNAFATPAAISKASWIVVLKFIDICT